MKRIDYYFQLVLVIALGSSLFAALLGLVAHKLWILLVLVLGVWQSGSSVLLIWQSAQHTIIRHKLKIYWAFIVASVAVILINQLLFARHESVGYVLLMISGLYYLSIMQKMVAYKRDKALW